MADFVTLAQGSGGRETQELLEQLIFSRVPSALKATSGGLGIDRPDDAAAIRVGEEYVVVTVDSYTVTPHTFPGGDIGVLAASGTINDVLMLGGRPIAALDSVVIEEGFPRATLERLTGNMLGVFIREGVPLIGGDLKVMPKGEIDGILITTAGLGIARRPIVDQELRAGDKILVSGNIAEHGATILAMQQSISPEDADLRSDVKPLTGLMLPLIEEYGDAIHAARDPTRGGLAMLLNDWARASRKAIVVDEASIPIREAVRRYTDMLGVNPLHLASEGVAVLGVDGDVAGDVLESMRGAGFTHASIIGTVKDEDADGGVVVIRTLVGGYRVLVQPSGEIVPRIC